MNKLILLLTVLLFASCSETPKAEKKNNTSGGDDKVLIKETFNNYKSAILNGKGEEAVGYVDSRTIAYYATILEAAKNADSTAVEAMDVMDKLMVFLIRYRTVKEELLSFDGKRLLVYAIKKGMVGKSSVVNTELGDVTVDGDAAKVAFAVGGEKSPYFFSFYKESNYWKMDLTSVFPVASAAFQQIIRDSGQEENEYLFYLIEMVTGGAPSNEIWQTIE